MSLLETGRGDRDHGNALLASNDVAAFNGQKAIVQTYNRPPLRPSPIPHDGGWAGSWCLPERYHQRRVRQLKESLMARGICLSVVGLAGIVFGMVADKFSTGFIASRGRPMPKWLGRSIFIAVGLWFIYWGWHQLSRS